MRWADPLLGGWFRCLLQHWVQTGQCARHQTQLSDRRGERHSETRGCPQHQPPAPLTRGPPESPWGAVTLWALVRRRPRLLRRQSRRDRRPAHPCLSLWPSGPLGRAGHTALKGCRGKSSNRHTQVLPPGDAVFERKFKFLYVKHHDCHLSLKNHKSNLKELVSELSTRSVSGGSELGPRAWQSPCLVLVPRCRLASGCGFPRSPALSVAVVTGVVTRCARQRCGGETAPGRWPRRSTGAAGSGGRQRGCAGGAVVPGSARAARRGTATRRHLRGVCVPPAPSEVPMGRRPWCGGGTLGRPRPLSECGQRAASGPRDTKHEPHALSSPVPSLPPATPKAACSAGGVRTGLLPSRARALRSVCGRQHLGRGVWDGGQTCDACTGARGPARVRASLPQRGPRDSCPGTAATETGLLHSRARRQPRVAGGHAHPCFFGACVLCVSPTFLWGPAYAARAKLAPAVETVTLQS